MRKPILSLDFDGVIHSYATGWHGPRKILDPPVPGALEFLVRAQSAFAVSVFSTRSVFWGGRRAMRRWLTYHYCKIAPSYRTTPQWFRACIRGDTPRPWRDDVIDTVKGIVGEISFPKNKPPALVTLDDRAITFEGEWPSIDDLREFRPWNRRW